MKAVQGDSRELAFVDDDSISLVVSSPPYWNKADYGSARVNLGRVAGYRRFLDEIRPVFEECYRVLQPGRKCCLVTANVNQHTDHGLLTFPLPADFAAMQTRSFAYVLLMPGEPGYDAMMALTDNLESVGRGLRRVIADAADIRGAWPECPLVTSIDTLAGPGA